MQKEEMCNKKMKKQYAQAALADSIWDEETSDEELAEAESFNLKRSIKSVKAYRRYRTYDGKLVFMRNFVLTNFMDRHFVAGKYDLTDAYESALQSISHRVAMAGFDEPILEIPFVLKKGGEYPNRLQIIQLIGDAIDDNYNESRLVITRVTDTFEGVIEKEISDIIEKLDWAVLSEDF